MDSLSIVYFSIQILSKQNSTGYSGLLFLPFFYGKRVKVRHNLYRSLPLQEKKRDETYFMYGNSEVHKNNSRARNNL